MHWGHDAMYQLFQLSIVHGLPYIDTYTAHVNADGLAITIDPSFPPLAIDGEVGTIYDSAYGAYQVVSWQNNVNTSVESMRIIVALLNHCVQTLTQQSADDTIAKRALAVYQESLLPLEQMLKQHQ